MMDVWRSWEYTQAITLTGRLLSVMERLHITDWELDLILELDWRKYSKLPEYEAE